MSSSSFLYNGQIYEIGEDNILRSEGIPYISVNTDGTFQFAGNVGDVPASFVSALANNTQLQQNILTAFGKVQSNVATTEQNPDNQGGSTSLPETQQPSEPSGFLMYPNDLTGEQDRIKFQALKYAPKIIPDNTSGQFESITPKYEIADIPVFLPIQSPITDQNSVGWEGDTLNPIELKAVQLSLSLMQNENMEQLQQEVAKTFTNAMNILKKESQAVRTYLAGQAVGVNNLLSRLDGQVLNPNLELLFQGPQLRPFNFTFKMSARSGPEATIIKKIIKYFKKNMSSTVGDNGLFLKAPNIFKIEYQKGTSRHQSINLIKECALTNCSVDYTPLGSYMTYSDDEGTMVAYTMTLSFQELTPIYDRDYLSGDGKDHSIGY